MKSKSKIKLYHNENYDLPLNVALIQRNVMFLIRPINNETDRQGTFVSAFLMVMLYSTCIVFLMKQHHVVFFIKYSISRNSLSEQYLWNWLF